MIVMKALRKEPQERYATVDQFSDDLENYLESRPIRARRGDAWYRTRKFVRRYWLPVAAVSFALAGLTGGVLVANHERELAQRRFLQVRQLSNKLLDIDLEASKIPGSTATRQLIVDTSLEYLQRLSAEVHGDSELAMEIGNAYLRVARVQGVPISQNLGQLTQSARNLDLAEGFFQAVLTSQPHNRTAMLRLAQVAHDRMLLARASGRDADTLRLARESAAWLEKFHAGKDDKPESLAVLSTYMNVAEQFMYRQQFDESLRLCREAMRVAAEMNETYFPGAYHWVSAEVLRRRGELDESLNEIRESVRILDPGTGRVNHLKMMNFTLAVIKQGRILGEDNAISMGRTDEALAFLERGFNLADNLVHQDPNDESPRGYLAMAGISMGNILRHSDARRALVVYDHTLHHIGEVNDNAHFRRYEISALAASSHALRVLGRSAEARQRLDAAFERLRAVKDYPAEKVKPGSEPDEALSALAELEAANGNIEGAIGIYQKLLDQVLAWGPHPESSLSDALVVTRLSTALANLHRQAHHGAPASEFEARNIELWRKWDSRLAGNSFVRRQLNAARAGEPQRAGM
jgi:tetratricopeptide (TPR) repeat protein